MTHTNLRAFIDSKIEINNIYIVWAAFKAVSQEADQYPFSCKRIGLNLFLSRDDETLVLIGLELRHSFLEILNSYYKDQGGIEMVKASTND